MAIIVKFIDSKSSNPLKDKKVYINHIGSGVFSETPYTDSKGIIKLSGYSQRSYILEFQIDGYENVQTSVSNDDVENKVSMTTK